LTANTAENWIEDLLTYELRNIDQRRAPCNYIIFRTTRTKLWTDGMSLRSDIPCRGHPADRPKPWISCQHRELDSVLLSLCRRQGLFPALPSYTGTGWAYLFAVPSDTASQLEDPAVFQLHYPSCWRNTVSGVLGRPERIAFPVHRNGQELLGRRCG
jgi:hypothetical protein